MHHIIMMGTYISPRICQYQLIYITFAPNTLHYQIRVNIIGSITKDLLITTSRHIFFSGKFFLHPWNMHCHKCYGVFLRCSRILVGVICGLGRFLSRTDPVCCCLFYSLFLSAGKILRHLAKWFQTAF